jgi:hypothetical protein
VSKARGNANELHGESARRRSDFFARSPAERHKIATDFTAARKQRLSERAAELKKIST